MSGDSLGIRLCEFLPEAKNKLNLNVSVFSLSLRFVVFSTPARPCGHFATSFSRDLRAKDSIKEDLTTALSSTLLLVGLDAQLRRATNNTTPGENITKIIRPEYFHVLFGGRPWQNYVIDKKLIPQELFCVLSSCRDLRLFHVELRAIYVTSKKVILRELFCVIGYAELSQ